MSTACTLYRHFDASGLLLYIGISLNPFQRTTKHRASEWFGEIASITLQHFPSQAAAEEAERLAIQTENPKYNKQRAKPHTRERAARAVPRSREHWWYHRFDNARAGNIREYRDPLSNEERAS